MKLFFCSNFVCINIKRTVFLIEKKKKVRFLAPMFSDIFNENSKPVKCPFCSLPPLIY